MTGGRLSLLAFAALTATLAGCGSSTQHTPSLTGLPLADGVHVVAQSVKCDKGANAFCGLEVVVAGPRYGTSDHLLRSEHLRLKSLGWSGVNADIGGERAFDSPGHKLHVTFATADTDLRGIDLGSIRRSRAIQLALSHQILARVPSLSMFLVEGPG
jgi:hypothetical protein